MLLMYVLFLKGETDFSVKRIFLIVSVVASVLFPLIQIDGARYEYVPSLMSIMPTQWLPEVVITAEGTAHQHVGQSNIWWVAAAIYSTGVVAALLLFIIRLFVVVRTLLPLRYYKIDNQLIFESDENKGSFSFFRFIYIGQARQLSMDERTMIIHHEQIHSQRLHSFDILLINTVGIFFWFNPVVGIYRKIFIQLHEFEADARSVSSRDVDNYCTLLAKVALLSADIPLANHFSNSLTVKRIEMMRTIKAKIKRWKYVAYAAVLPSFFFVVACQEQVMNDLTDVAKNSTQAVLVPAEVQARYDELKQAKPDAKFLLLDLNDEAVSKLESFGPLNSVELFAAREQFKGPAYPDAVLTAKNLKITESSATQGHTYAIVEYSDAMGTIAERAKSGDEVYNMVDDPATFPGGIEGLMEYLQTNLKYPKTAREQGIEGTVFISFIVEKDGTVTSPETAKGVSPEVDASALSVVQSFPKWSPGKHSGKVVRSKFVIPIRFKLAQDSPK